MAPPPSNGSESHGLHSARVSDSGSANDQLSHPERNEGPSATSDTCAFTRTPPSPALLESAWSKLPPEYRIPDQAPSLEEANAYCERLARSHYENFSVATWFLPERLRPHFHSVYAYCRISDDLGDEVGDAQQSLALLDLWESELNATYASVGRDPDIHEFPPDTNVDIEKGTDWFCSDVPTGPAGPRHPVFVALSRTICACDIPKQPFVDLLRAFRQDQTVKRYDTFDQLREYCRYSADPVGRLVLYICGYREDYRQELSDNTCTALQLANFWQDVSVDYGKGRIYLPRESMSRFGVTEDQIGARRFTSEFRELMRFEVNRAREWFERGLPLAKEVDRELAVDIELFSRGGLEILNAIEHQDFDVLRSRPAISKLRKLSLVARAALRRLVA
ncbi:MAG TPA: squalene synthase HpnC [Terriglobales bacterium]|nr:squalene synthase HpnC [Terriglobales bacterium]